MAYRTVLVHCNDRRRIANLAETAAALARPFEAHLVGLSVTPPAAIIPSGMPGAPDAIVVDAHCVAYRRDNPVMRAAFEATARSFSLRAQWLEADADRASVADVVLGHARTADIVVAAQSDRSWQSTPYLDVADRLAVESGRPVLIAANGPPRQGFGKRLLVAWNARREAARAVFDRLPLLQRAEEVKAITVRPQEEQGSTVAVPAGDICAGAAWRQVRERQRRSAGKCGAHIADARHRVWLRPAGDGMLRPFAAARVRARRGQPACAGTHGDTGPDVALKRECRD
jgi:hypothetical protein